MKKRFLVTLFIPLFVCTSCSKVEPWDKEVLAKPIMAFDTDPLEAKSKQHIYFSKEASSGGYGLGGGGCGCN